MRYIWEISRVCWNLRIYLVDKSLKCNFAFAARRLELPMIIAENKKDVLFCTIYFRIVLVAAILAFSNPIIEACYIYYTSGELILRPPYKARQVFLVKKKRN